MINTFLRLAAFSILISRFKIKRPAGTSAGQSQSSPTPPDKNLVDQTMNPPETPEDWETFMKTYTPMKSAALPPPASGKLLAEYMMSSEVDPKDWEEVEKALERVRTREQK
jgi:hypothetical protein